VKPVPSAPGRLLPRCPAPKAPVTAAPAEIESPMLAPEQQETSPEPEAAKAEAAKAEPPRMPGKLLIMSPADRAWNGGETAAKPDAAATSETPVRQAPDVGDGGCRGAGNGGRKRPVARWQPSALGHMMRGDSQVTNSSALEASVARIDADIQALKVSLEHTSKMGMSQFNKTSDRLDKVEKAQAEPAAKLAKLSEAVEKLRAAPASAAVAAVTPVAAKDITASVAPPVTVAAAAPIPTPAPMPEVARLPTVDGWVIRDIGRGGALIESRRGLFEVYAGDSFPGLGRVDAIRRQDGKWVVVTSKGLIVAR